MSKEIRDFLIELSQDPLLADQFRNDRVQAIAQAGFAGREAELLMSSDVRTWRASFMNMGGGEPNGTAANGGEPNGIAGNGVEPNGIADNGGEPNGIGEKLKRRKTTVKKVAKKKKAKKPAKKPARKPAKKPAKRPARKPARKAAKKPAKKRGGRR